MNSDFLPTEYEVPASSSQYMKFQPGDNKFRILSAPIVGWEYWVRADGTVKVPNDKSMKGDSPKRVKYNDPRPDKVTDPTSYKHFWAMVVWNCKEEKIQILEITQSGIQKSLTALSKSPDWGNPVQAYDIVINKTGEKLETEYQTNHCPPKKIDPGIAKLYEDMEIDINRLFEGKDPFKEDLSETVNE